MVAKYARHSLSNQKTIEERIKLLRLSLSAWMFKQRLIDRFNKLLKKEEGATIAEYAILLAVVVVSLIAILTRLNSALRVKIETIIDEINKAPTS